MQQVEMPQMTHPWQFRLVIFGSREFSDYPMLERKLDSLLSKKIAEGYEIIVISGAARGADSLGEKYAKSRGYAIERYPANWNKYGKSAGYRRNETMAQMSDAGVGFWNGISKGTGHMVNLLKKYNKEFRIVRF